MIRKPKIIVAITGASGSVYAQLLLQKLSGIKNQFDELAVIVSSEGEKVWQHELGYKPTLPDGFTRYANDNFFAPRQAARHFSKV